VIDPKRRKKFQKEILEWYAKHQRDLPWRRDREPYHILVSEIMLQQTQVSRVIPKYEAWLEQFPDVTSLAQAKTSEMLRLWSGLGYNRRALFLQKAAQALEEIRIKNYEVGKKEFWPRTVEELRKLPGIGEYTARAVACFAFDQQVAVVDTNVRKVILTKYSPYPQGEREYILPSPFKGEGEDEGEKVLTDKEIQKIADELLPKGRAYEWNQALMDYASARLKNEKIPIKKQSRFKDSNRFYRGQTVKLLLEYKGASIKYIGEKLGKDETFMENIIQGLEKDGLVKRKNDTISLA
jgi:A/G-specific adenine glycosylase